MSVSFQCCVCLETLVNPKALQCGHSFCSSPKNCLQKVLTNNPKKCSKCRKPFASTLKESDLSENYDLKAAIEVSCINFYQNL